jgi:tRNA(fMet)-specific endonuclease VapC
MALWILDTDHVSMFVAGNPSISLRAAEKFPDVAIAIVTVQEIFNGWVSRINNTSEAEQLVHLYTKLWQTTEFFKSIPILNFTEAASRCYRELIAQNKSLTKKRLEKDLRIAAIALSVNGIIVTRNHKDFSLVSHLQIEDWSS